jgi:hypothetical protein
VVPEQK